MDDDIIKVTVVFNYDWWLDDNDDYLFPLDVGDGFDEQWSPI